MGNEACYCQAQELNGGQSGGGKTCSTYSSTNKYLSTNCAQVVAVTLLVCVCVFKAI